MTLRLNGSTSGYVEVDSQAVGGNNTIQLPSSNGSANQFLKNGSTAGTLGWSSLVEDSSGRLLVGTSTSNSNTNSKFQIADTSGNVTTTSYSANNSSAGYYYFFKNRGASVDSHTVLQSGDGIANLYFAGSDGTTYRGAASIEAVADGGWSSGDAPGRLTFSVTPDGSATPVERLRLSSTGTFNLLTADYGFVSRSTTSAGTANFCFAATHSATTVFSGTTSFYVYTNGNVQNTNNSYGQISDVKLKENIVDAGSQWSDLKAIRVRNFNFKEGQTHRQIGVIAQEIEQVSPGLVYETPDRDEDGNETGEVTKGVNYSVLYMKAVKALQEAMERIETLEASNADLAARLTALEANS